MINRQDRTSAQLGLYQELYRLFNSRGFSLYLVGGTVRDYLLKIPLTDMDLVTDATPEEMKEFIPQADYTFAKFGSVKLMFRQHKFDITTMRQEKSYVDFRHPGKIVFTKSLEEDVSRRDFTINALYMDHNYTIIDFVDGQKDIENKRLKMVGNPDVRLKEDPLRIVRALRFAIDCGFWLDTALKEAIQSNCSDLDKLNPEKVQEEIRKCHNPEKLVESLNQLRDL